ncbi:MAG: hypothetical protein JXQ97_08470 [Natronospirillum sp.]
MKYVLNLTLLCGLLSALTVHAADYDAAYYEAYRQYMAAAEGESRATRRAVEQFTALHNAQPQDPVAMVLLGSSQTLQGRDALLPWNKLNHTETGLDTMAQAQALLTPSHSSLTFDNVPASIMVPLTAAITYVQVPDFFGRFEQGYSMLQDISRHPDLHAVPAEERTVIHYYTALAAQRVDEPAVAERAMDALFALNVEDEYTALAQKNLRP